MDSRLLRSMTIGPSILEMQFDLENSGSKIKVKCKGQRYPSLWTHALRLQSLAWTCKLTPNFYNAYPVETGAYIMEILDPSRPVHISRLKPSKWTFSTWFSQGGRFFFPRWVNGLPVWYIDTIPCTNNWAPSQYKDRLIYVWWFPC